MLSGSLVLSYSHNFSHAKLLFETDITCFLLSGIGRTRALKASRRRCDEALQTGNYLPCESEP